MVRRHPCNSFSVPTQTHLLPPREDATRARAGVRVGGPPRRAEGGGRAGGGRRAVPRAARVELSLILGWLTACLPRVPPCAYLRP